MSVALRFLTKVGVVRNAPSAAVPSPLLPSQVICADYSKIYGRSRSKRLPMTTKRAKKGFYKGNGATQEGRHTSKGAYVMDRRKMLELVVPSLDGFKVGTCGPTAFWTFMFLVTNH
jgi:hypothetical protein